MRFRIVLKNGKELPFKLSLFHVGQGRGGLSGREKAGHQQRLTRHPYIGMES